MSNHKQFAVLGMGTFGRSLASTLYQRGYEVLGIDRDIEIVQHMSEYITQAVQGDVSDDQTLKHVGISNFDVVIIAMADNLEDTILSAILVKEMGVPMIIAKASNEMQKKILTKIGVDKVILPEIEMGERTAIALTSNNMVDFFDLSDEFRIAEISPLKEWIGKSVVQCGIRANYGLNIAAIKRGARVFIVIEPSKIIDKDDTLIVIGENKNIDKMMEHGS